MHSHLSHALFFVLTQFFQSSSEYSLFPPLAHDFSTANKVHPKQRLAPVGSLQISAPQSQFRAGPALPEGGMGPHPSAFSSTIDGTMLPGWMCCSFSAQGMVAKAELPDVFAQSCLSPQPLHPALPRDIFMARHHVLWLRQKATDLDSLCMVWNYSAVLMRRKTLRPVMSEIRKSGKQQMCDLAALLLLSPLSCVLQLFKVLILEKGEGKARCRFHSSSKSHLVEQLTGF